MFQVNEVNTSESILFLGCARVTLSEMIKASLVKEKKELSSFVLNEASDYQIMSLLVEGELPDKKSDIFEEERLFDDLKDLITNNYLELSELVNGDVLNTFVHEVGSIAPKGMSSALPLLEFAIERGPVSEEYFWKRVQEQFPGEELGSLKGGVTPEKIKAAIATTKAAYAAAQNKLGLAKDGLKTLLAKKTAGVTGAQAKALTMQISHQKEKIATLTAKTNTIGATLRTLGGQLKAALAKGATAGVAGAKAAAAKGAVAAKAAAAKGAVVAKGAAAKGAAAVTPALQAIGTKTGAAGIAAKFGVGSAGAGVGVLGAAALAALLAYAAVKTYRRYFSQAGKACRGTSGAEKTACLKKYRIGALKAQLADLKRGSAACAKSKDPAGCKKMMAVKMAKVQKKMAKAA